MSDIKGFIVSEEQQNINSVDTFQLIIWNMSEIYLSNLTNRHLNDSTNYPSYTSISTSLTYTIIFGLVCACLCFLTIAGNLLVLITFRRMRTVSIYRYQLIQWLINRTVYIYETNRNLMRWIEISDIELNQYEFLIKKSRLNKVRKNIYYDQSSTQAY